MHTDAIGRLLDGTYRDPDSDRPVKVATRALAIEGSLAGLERDLVASLDLGTRLAVFTPLPELGLIVVDEEQDASFKQAEGLRYSARDLAIARARQRGVPVVLGSATPALETYHNAVTGRYGLGATTTPYDGRWYNTLSTTGDLVRYYDKLLDGSGGLPPERANVILSNLAASTPMAIDGTTLT